MDIERNIISLKDIAPFSLPIRLRKDEIVDEERGFAVVKEGLDSEQIILLGDQHKKPKTHDLFTKYLKKLDGQSLQFLLAVELPYQLTPVLNNGSVEDAMHMYTDIITRFDNTSPQNYLRYRNSLSTILYLAKEQGRRIIAIDDGKIDDAASQANNFQGLGVRSRAEWMAGILQQAKKRYGMGVLTMVGGNHAEAGGIPRYVDAVAIRMGEDISKQFFPRMFDYFISLPADTGSYL